MTDELEVLLEEENEESAVPESLSIGKALPLKKQREPGETELAGNGLENAEFPEEGAKVRIGEPVEIAGFTQGKRAVRRDVRAVYTALVRNRQAAEYRPERKRETVKLVKEPNFQTGELDAAGLDRLFQRDARRYDGGFTWQ